MRNKVSKILFVLLLLLFPAISSACNVHAQGDCIIVSSTEIDLSPNFLLHTPNLNTPEMKRYLIRCIELSEVSSEIGLKIIKENSDCSFFFCLKTQIHNSEGQTLLHIWIPNDKLNPRSSGTFYTFPMKYAEKT